MSKIYSLSLNCFREIVPERNPSSVETYSCVFIGLSENKLLKYLWQRAGG